MNEASALSFSSGDLHASFSSVVPTVIVPVVTTVVLSVPNDEPILAVVGSNFDLKQPRAGDEKEPSDESRRPHDCEKSMTSFIARCPDTLRVRRKMIHASQRLI